jgi:hypothetical protein
MRTPATEIQRTSLEAEITVFSRCAGRISLAVRHALTSVPASLYPPALRLEGSQLVA